jgi:hypothetical protein
MNFSFNSSSFQPLEKTVIFPESWLKSKFSLSVIKIFWALFIHSSKKLDGDNYAFKPKILLIICSEKEEKL